MQVGYKKLLFSTSISLHRVLTLRPLGVINTVQSDRGKLVTLIADSSKRQSLLMAGDERRVFMTRSLDVTPKTTEQNLIVRSNKSDAEVINKSVLEVGLLY